MFHKIARYCLLTLIPLFAAGSELSDAARGVLASMEWASIPAGEFLMGSTEQEADNAFSEALIRSSLLERSTFELEQPLHAVQLDAYDVSVYEITNAQYRAFVEDAGHAPPVANDGSPLWDNDEARADDLPVVGVSWFDANAFAGWLGASLPSEAQWERAARGTERRKFPWGDQTPTPLYANFARRRNKPVAVGTFPRGATPEGVHDLGGNVWEWCLDEDDPDYYARSPRANPVNLGDPQSMTDRVIRGGSWDMGQVFMRAALRFRFHPTRRHETIGFRVVRPTEATAPE